MLRLLLSPQHNVLYHFEANWIDFYVCELNNILECLSCTGGESLNIDLLPLLIFVKAADKIWEKFILRKKVIAYPCQRSLWPIIMCSRRNKDALSTLAYSVLSLDVYREKQWQVRVFVITKNLFNWYRCFKLNVPRNRWKVTRSKIESLFLLYFGHLLLSWNT